MVLVGMGIWSSGCLIRVRGDLGKVGRMARGRKRGGGGVEDEHYRGASRLLFACTLALADAIIPVLTSCRGVWAIALSSDSQAIETVLRNRRPLQSAEDPD